MPKIPLHEFWAQIKEAIYDNSLLAYLTIMNSSYFLIVSFFISTAGGNVMERLWLPSLIFSLRLTVMTVPFVPSTEREILNFPSILRSTELCAIGNKFKNINIIAAIDRLKAVT